MHLFINGQRENATGNETVDLIDPATGAVVQQAVRLAGADDIEKAVRSARTAQRSWGRTTPAERSAVLTRLATLLESNIDELAETESREVGKPIRMSRHSDIPMVVDTASFFAGAARQMEGLASGEYVQGYTSWVRREPVGVVAGIAPWNFPLLMAAWKAFAPLAAGNSVILKPSQLTPSTTLRLAELAIEAGLPAGVLNVLIGSGRTVGHALASHAQVDMVSFTGSTAGGREVMRAAAGRNTRVQLELGGKAPFVVFDDADLDAAIQGAVAGTITNAGQDCAAATRAYVHHSRFDDFVEGVSAILATIRLGDPMDPRTEMGPLVSGKQLASVEYAVDRARADGATVVTGGRRATDTHEGGYYYEPTLITGAAQGSFAVQTEIFGPVLTALPFDSDDEAFELANDTEYGLVASAWTSDLQRAMRASREMNAGCVWINDHLPLASEMPQGGVGSSGFGKDMSKYSLEEYTTVRHVMADITGAASKDWHRTLFDAR